MIAVFRHWSPAWRPTACDVGMVSVGIGVAWLFTAMNRTKVISKYVLASFMIAAGTTHFVNPEFFLKIMPPYLPFHHALVLVSGLCEAALGILLLVPRCSRWAAWGIVALLIAVFPANLHLYQHQEIIPASPLVHLLRLPFQGVFILWAYWHTRAAAETP